MRPTYLLILIFVLLITSCKEDPCDHSQQPVHRKYTLNHVTKSKIRYRQDGKDTLLFFNDAGDTATLFGKEVSLYFMTETENRSNHPDCPLMDTFSFENLEYEFTGTHPLLNHITFKPYATRSTSAFSDDVAIDINGAIYTTWFDALYYAGNYKDSVTINGNTLYGMPLTDINKTQGPIMFHPDHGVIKIELDNQTWKRRL